jgi:hypothetical protein
MVYKDAPTSEIHSFKTFCSSQLLVESESSCFTIEWLQLVLVSKERAWMQGCLEVVLDYLGKTKFCTLMAV